MSVAFPIALLVFALVLFLVVMLEFHRIEGNMPVPYYGMFTTRYTSRRQPDGSLIYYRGRFPIGVWGMIDVLFWNVFDRVVFTSTYNRYVEWQKLPIEKAYEVIPATMWPYKEGDKPDASSN